MGIQMKTNEKQSLAAKADGRATGIKKNKPDKQPRYMTEYEDRDLIPAAESAKSICESVALFIGCRVKPKEAEAARLHALDIFGDGRISSGEADSLAFHLP